ncbi:hypothetical protein ACQP0C_37980 [Nocardia sp. CA-129566]|uniref:hypothetical protein n=1 Tax=Nocardia sp. CA-129566 TaxID=3239976 RepID=UPI003D98D1A5
MSGWAEVALNSVLDRAEKTRAVVGERLPLYAERNSGAWVTTSRGSWTGGFWAGLLWLRALHTGSADDRSAAAQVTARLADWVGADTATRGLIFWYGTALAANAGGDRTAAELGAEAARACLDDFDHELGVLPWGSAFGGPRLLARVDGVAGILPLLATASGTAAAKAHLDTHLTPRRTEPVSTPARGWADGDCAARPQPLLATASGTAAAKAHLDTHLIRWRTDPVFTPAWAWTDGEWVACSQPRTGWSRGRAWLLLALADASWHIDTGYLDAAEELIDDTAPLIPPAELTPDAPPDTSAAAIEVVALLKLAAAHHIPDRAVGLRNRAIKMLEQLTTRHLNHSGMLLDGCYDLDRNLATAHELIWGDYFFALALAIHTGAVAPFDT